MEILDVHRDNVRLVESPAGVIAEPGRVLRLRIVYFLVIPFAIGAFFGWARFGALAAAMPREVAVVYAGTISVLLWHLRWLVTGALLQVSFVDRLPLPALLAIGATISEVLARPLQLGAVVILSPWFDAPIPSFENWIPTSPSEVGGMLIGCSPVILAWMGVTIFYQRWLGVTILPGASVVRPIMDHQPEQPGPLDQPAVDSSVAEPVEADSSIGCLINRLPSGFGEVRALRALDHYVEVRGDRGSVRILYRFEDAVRELTGAGLLRVHRSFCIETASVLKLDSQGRRRFACLGDGLRVPVSAPYLKALLARRPDLRGRLRTPRSVVRKRRVRT